MEKEDMGEPSDYCWHGLLGVITELNGTEHKLVGNNGGPVMALHLGSIAFQSVPVIFGCSIFYYDICLINIC